MPVVTLVFSLLLIGMGLVGYFGSSSAEPSLTALIPAVFGVLLGLCGLAALKDNLRKHAMHAASAIGLFGLFAAGGRAAMKAAQKGIDFSNRADIMLVGMAVVCLVFVALCVNSFIAARRRRAAEAK